MQFNVVPDTFDEAAAWALGMAVLGVVLVLIVDHFGRRAADA